MYLVSVMDVIVPLTLIMEYATVTMIKMMFMIVFMNQVNQLQQQIGVSLILKDVIIIGFNI